MSTPPFDDYVDLLRSIQAERGLRQFQFAELLGQSPAWLSQIYNRKRQLQPDLAEQIADRLALSQRLRVNLQALVESEAGNSTFTRERANHLIHGLSKPEPAESTPVELQIALGRWHVGAILELARCDGWIPDPSWIVATIWPAVSIEEAAEALEVLREAGLLDADHQIVDPAPDLGTARHHRGRDEVNAAIHGHHQQALAIAAQALRTIEHSNEYLFAAASLALSEDDYLNLRSRLEELVAPLLYGAAKEKPNRVFQFNLSLFPVTLYSDNARDNREDDEE